MDIDIKGKDFVKIHYTGALSDGAVFDSSEGKDPLAFILDIGMLIPGLEKSVKEAEKGDKKTVKIPPAEAYGEVDDKAIQDVPKTQFPEDLELKEGLQLQAQTQQGPIPVVVKEIKPESVMVDFNHPLAGEELKFDYEVVEKRPATEEDLKNLMEQK
ncbi:MAG: FKBP-type peptidyl-prolyl cis-trans isomerase [Bacteroidales bacterium]|jgi:FKBP-type peptidyl-prolyl cis-trans isomerase 2